MWHAFVNSESRDVLRPIQPVASVLHLQGSTLPVDDGRERKYTTSAVTDTGKESIDESENMASIGDAGRTDGQQGQWPR